ncbi:acyl-CoA dehydrogenase family protein [Egicoccus halophilus]|uniref:Acyl-CoA dehydrogenase n=1 Tax=Egicoccus halophilus TaxID=1670830 RepID=A0A8J3EYY6_9ACTN|nr:acyl-CoA dehydrogenase family protein [Egicoccus halophilus]GGI08805.1 acyl-CoA dehydrogenase [Egicoccus halophilus]
MGTVEQHGFFQAPPRLRDEWEDDLALRRCLERLLPTDVHHGVVPTLAELGRLAATDLKAWSDAMDDPAEEPRLRPFDAWGNRVDRVETSPYWARIAEVAATHGVVATAYERAHGEHSRVHQFALAYLFAPSSALYSCPLAMTDGAAKTLLVHGDRELVERAVPRLTSRDPATAWTSGQWMTERPGGSDVGRTETVARAEGPLWRLTGTKWFTSAVTADMALTLARPEGNGPGGRGLAMFYVEVRDAHGRLNDLRVLRLKSKLGTRQMPTAELALDGTLAQLVGPPADGTRNITPMLTVTRLWNAVTAASGLRRALALARDYAGRREAFGSALVDQPLHQATLAWLRVQHESSLQLAFHAVALLGRDEAGVATEREQQALRLLLPITKLTTGKQAVAGASEALEAFGGAGYIEDTHLPQLLRDAQVLPIWEGTTNVLSLDVVRALGDHRTLAAYVEEVRRAAGLATSAPLATVGKLAVDAADHASRWVTPAADAGPAALQHGARRLALTLGRALQAALLAAQAQHDLDVHADGRATAVAQRFAAEGLDLLEAPGDSLTTDAALARDDVLPWLAEDG